MVMEKSHVVIFLRSKYLTSELLRTSVTLLYWYQLSRFNDFFGVRESLYPRNLIFEVTRGLLIKNTEKFNIRMKITKFSQKIPQSQKSLLTKVNFGPWRSRKFIPRNFIPINDITKVELLLQ